MAENRHVTLKLENVSKSFAKVEADEVTHALDNVSVTMESGEFVRSDAAFSFPYGFKHGTLLTITEEEFDRMKAHDWNNVPDRR